MRSVACKMRFNILLTNAHMHSDEKDSAGLGIHSVNDAPHLPAVR